ncbi:MAG: GNAT family N-acetyltransferase [Candidatus Thorarchaeota archaeon]|jgi:GNAT superfamily N-acetyltransferase
MSESNRYAVVNDPTDEEAKKFRQGLESYNMEKTNGEFNSPQPWHNLVLKDKEGNVIGGILTSTLYWTQYLEVLWVDERYRRLGYGRDLVMEAQRLAKEIGCISSHVYTFSWQAPDFYQAVGYDLMVTYEGYHSGIKEHVLMTRLDSLDERKIPRADSDRFAITSDPSEEEIKTVRLGLGQNFTEHVQSVMKEHPHTDYCSVTKSEDGEVIGGISGYTTLGILNIAEFWVDEKHCGLGYGKDLLMHAEALAKERRCIAGQIACFSFQNLEFLKSQGYEILGFSDAYPNDVREYYLTKIF